MMKKKFMLLFILGLFVISIMAGVVHAQTDSQVGMLKRPLQMFGSLLETVVGGIFDAITEKPDIWMRFLMFIGIYAVLFMALNSTPAQQTIDRKTAGIIGFVLAFGTVAIMPVAWLIAALSVWGGLIMAVLIAVPAILLLAFTIGVLRGKEHIAWKIITIILAWLIYIALVSTVSGALIHKATTATTTAPSTFIESFDNAMYRAQTFQFVIDIVMIIGLVSIIALFLSLLFGTTGGRTLVADSAKWAGKRFDKLPLIGWMSRTGSRFGSEYTISSLIEEYEKYRQDITGIKRLAKQSTKEQCKTEINNLYNGFTKLNKQQEATLITAVEEIIEGLDDELINTDITQAPANISNTMQVAEDGAAEALENVDKDRVEWDKVKQELNKTQTNIKTITDILNTVIKAHGQQSKRQK